MCVRASSDTTRAASTAIREPWNASRGPSSATTAPSSATRASSVAAGKLRRRGEAGEVDPGSGGGEEASEGAAVIHGVERRDDRPAFRRPGAPARSVHVEHPTAPERTHGRDVAQDEAVPARAPISRSSVITARAVAPGSTEPAPGSNNRPVTAAAPRWRCIGGTVAQGPTLVRQHAHGDVEAGRRAVQVRRQDPCAPTHVVEGQPGTDQVQGAALPGAPRSRPPRRGRARRAPGPRARRARRAAGRPRGPCRHAPRRSRPSRHRAR